MEMLGFAIMIIGAIVLVIGFVLLAGFLKQNWEISGQDFEQKIKTSGIAPTARTGSDAKRLEIVKRLGITQKKKDTDFGDDNAGRIGYYDETEEIVD